MTAQGWVVLVIVVGAFLQGFGVLLVGIEIRRTSEATLDFWEGLEKGDREARSARDMEALRTRGHRGRRRRGEPPTVHLRPQLEYLRAIVGLLLDITEGSRLRRIIAFWSLLAGILLAAAGSLWALRLAAGSG